MFLCVCLSKIGQPFGAWLAGSFQNLECSGSGERQIHVFVQNTPDSGACLPASHIHSLSQ
jgi:hypothetical protein